MQNLDQLIRDLLSGYPSLALLLLLALIAGGLAIAWRYAYRRGVTELRPQVEKERSEAERWRNEVEVQKQSRQVHENRAEQFAEALANARSENAALQGRLELVPRLEANVRDLQERLVSAEQRHAEAQHARGQLEARLVEQRNAAAEKLALLERAREELKQSFAGLANDILEEKSKRFGQQNIDQIGQLLTPMREQL
ncbi:MAG: hypothetical protein KDI71_08775, partial [Xanthomonadales bacterium]|nr:hypothetical protein [Xanthomonadales bacterium]